MKTIRALLVHRNISALLLVALALWLAPLRAYGQASFWHYGDESGSSDSFYPDYEGEVEIYAENETDGVEFDWYVEADNYSYEAWEDIEYVGLYAGALQNDSTVLADGADYDEPYEASVEVWAGITRGDSYDFWGYVDACYLSDPTDWDDTDCSDESIGEIDFITTANVPSVSSISVNSGAVGTSGSTQVTGTDLIDDFQYSSVGISGGVQSSIESGETTTQATVDFTIPQSAPVGSQQLLMSNTWGAGNGVTFTVGDSTPVITGISPDIWNAGATTNVTITGQGFGTSPLLSIACGGGGTCPAIDSYGIVGTPSDTQIMVSVAVDPSAPNESVDLSVTSQGYGGSGFTGTGGSGQPATSGQQSASISAAPAAPSFAVAYSSYIPVDHVTGYNSCYYVVPTGALLTYFTYKGDGGYGSYRTTEAASFTPSTLNIANFFPNTGLSKQYGFGSPTNGSTLSYLDEDGVPNDCYLWNGTEQAPYSNFTYSTSDYAPSVGAITFTGSASNPFESTLAAITWDMTTFIDVSNPSQPTAYVTYGHTCYPAHQVKVGANNTVVYSYTPPSNTLPYIASCLTTGVNLLTEVSGTTSPVTVTAQ